MFALGRKQSPINFCNRPIAEVAPTEKPIAFDLFSTYVDCLSMI